MDFTLPDNFEFYSRFVLGGTGIFAIIMQLRSYFSESRRKQKLKTDLEILELSEKSKLAESGIIRQRVIEMIDNTYNSEVRGDRGISNFITGIVVFIGFGLWTIDILKKSYPDFNAWSILTLFCALAGLSMLLFDNRKLPRDKPFITIGIYDKSGLRFSIVLTLTCGLILATLIWLKDHFTFGMFISGLFCFIGLITFRRSFKKIK